MGEGAVERRRTIIMGFIMPMPPIPIPPIPPIPPYLRQRLPTALPRAYRGGPLDATRSYRGGHS